MWNKFENGRKNMMEKIIAHSFVFLSITNLEVIVSVLIF